MKFVKWLTGCVGAIAFVFLSLSVAIEVPAFSMWFYKMEFDKNGTYAQVDMQKDDLNAVTRHMLSYMAGMSDELNINTVVAGQSRLFFSDIEIFHMKDVRGLTVITIRVTIASIILLLFCALSVYLMQKRRERRYLLKNEPTEFGFFFRSLRNVCIGVIAVVGALAAIVAIDFDGAFIKFHEIFFDNDAWLLDPSKDLLLNIVPTEFFIDAAILGGAVFIFLLVVGVVVSAFVLRGKPAGRMRLSRRGYDY
ncbi:hypothetical protein FACS189490_06920 [Clostridia bacterium]|nr:hypothetical protein FACS189490_06920 [Clostridia bacterium]